MKRAVRRPKITPSKARNVISISKKVLRDQASILSKKKRSQLLPPFLRKNPEKAEKVLHDLRSTSNSLIQISRETNVSFKTVYTTYLHLIASGEEIPLRKRGQLGGFPKGKPTGQLSTRKISSIVRAQEPKIVRKAQYVYTAYRDLFNRAGIGPEDIASHIREKLPYKLELFDASTVKAVSGLDEKIDIVCRRQLNLLSLDMRRKAGRRTQKYMRSLEESLTGEKKTAGEKVLSRKDFLAGGIKLEDPEAAISFLERVSGKAGLFMPEKAVLFATFTGFTQRQIADMFAVSKPSISYIFGSLKEKLVKAGFAPEEKKGK